MIKWRKLATKKFSALVYNRLMPDIDKVLKTIPACYLGNIL
jgi:hypothetical protein